MTSLADLTATVSFADATTAVLTVAAGAIGVVLVLYGIRKLRGQIR